MINFILRFQLLTGVFLIGLASKILKGIIIRNFVPKSMKGIINQY